jgi:hypothetical protein
VVLLNTGKRDKTAIPKQYVTTFVQLRIARDLLFDLDGLAAPQGRAFDGSLQVGWQASPNYDLSIGYRTVEGGAKNSTVSTFAWVHYLVFGATVRF